MSENRTDGRYARGMKRLWTPAWILRHVLTVVTVVAFCALGWWQISRARAGNTLSWAYAVEWPIFAGFVIFLWIREARYTLQGGRDAADTRDASADRDDGTTPAGATPTGPRPAPGFRRPVRTARPRPVVTDGDDPALAAYNHYLAWLNANPGARPADYPGYPGPAAVRRDESWAQP